MAYAKLFSTITESSLWSASKDARLLFLSMLAKADQVGFVEAALPGLARLANLTMAETEAALAELMAADPYSKSPDCDGARVVKVDRGWCLVNYEFYRDQQGTEDRRAYMRRYMQERRCKQSVNSRKQKLAVLGQAEAEADTEAEREARAPVNFSVNNPEEGESRSLSPEELDEGSRRYLEGLGAITRKRNGEDILEDWKAAAKGLKAGQVAELFKEVRPGIQWPSEFKRARKERGL